MNRISKVGASLVVLSSLAGCASESSSNRLQNPRETNESLVTSPYSMRVFRPDESFYDSDRIFMVPKDLDEKMIYNPKLEIKPYSAELRK